MTPIAGLVGEARHPDDFFEGCAWVGFAGYGLAFAGSYGWVARGGPALILGSILEVTGVPATEAQALRSKGDACRRDQATTSALVPWPRRPRHAT